MTVSGSAGKKEWSSYLFRFISDTLTCVLKKDREKSFSQFAIGTETAIWQKFFLMETKLSPERP